VYKLKDEIRNLTNENVTMAANIQQHQDARNSVAKQLSKVQALNSDLQQQLAQAGNNQRDEISDLERDCENA